MRYSFLGAALAAALLAGSGTLQAQGAKRPVELGIDMGIGFGLDDPKTTAISLPMQSVRAGFFINDRVSIEPQMSLQHMNISGFGSTTSFGLGVGALFHFSPDRTRNQMYLRPMLGLVHASAFDESSTQASLGVGFGAKLPIMQRLAGRLEGTLGHAFETDNAAGRTSIGLLAGLSFFTR